MLKVRGIHKKYIGKRSSWALKGVALELQPGQHGFVIGETGSGKSTLLKIIYGSETPEKGSVNWKGEKQNHQNQLIYGFNGMKLVEQDFNLKMFNTVRGVIESDLPVGLLKSEIKAKTDELLTLFELQKSAHKQVLELSGGQQQRVAIAKAFASLPELLLLDEPFAHLDPQLKNNIFRYLQNEIRDNNLSVLTITHDYTETLKYADIVLAMHKGKVVQRGEVAELYERPVNLYVAGLLGEFNVIIEAKELSFCRPEHIQLNKGGEFKGELVAKRFCGHFYEIDIKMNTNILLAIVPHTFDIEIDETVQFDIAITIPIADDETLVYD